MKAVKQEWFDTLLVMRNFNSKSKRIVSQKKDLLKLVVLVPIFVLPGGTLLVLGLVKYGKKIGLDFSLSKSFPKKDKK